MPALDLSVPGDTTGSVLTYQIFPLILLDNEACGPLVSDLSIREVRLTGTANSRSETPKFKFSCRRPFMTSIELRPLKFDSPYDRQFLMRKKTEDRRRRWLLGQKHVHFIGPPVPPGFRQSVRDSANYLRALQRFQENQLLIKKRLASVPDGFERKLLPNGQIEQYASSKGSNFVHEQKFFRPVLVPRLIRRKIGKRRNYGMSARMKVNHLDYNLVKWAFPQLAAREILRFPGTNQLLRVEGCPIYAALESYGLDRPWPTPSIFVTEAADVRLQYSNEIDSVRSIALRRLNTRIQRQYIDLATGLSQSMQTVNMILDYASRLAKGISQLKSGRLSAFVKTIFPTSLKRIANDRLAFVYGVKPLMSDIDGAVQHLAELLHSNPPVKFNGHAKNTFGTSEVTYYYAFDNSEFPVFKLTVSETALIRAKFGAYFSLSNPILRAAAQLGFTNPANVLWENLKGSFIADWFYPIGDYLKSVSALDGLTPLEIYSTVFIDRKVSCRVDLLAVPTGESSTLDALSAANPAGVSNLYTWSFEQKHCYRVVEEDIPLASPKFKNPLSKDHVLNSLSLILQKLK